MARMIDKQVMLNLIIDAKRTDPETGSFAEWLAEYLVQHLSTLTQPNEPLTWEELKEMAGEPVYIVEPKKSISSWMLIDEVDEKSMWCVVETGSCYRNFYKTYGKTWLAYAYPPAHIDREAWEPCEYCNGKINLYQHTHTTKLFMNTFREAATLVTECMACPPYADCCMNGISANSAFKINFCPNCGRPLTEESWEELEKRVRGEK